MCEKFKWLLEEAECLGKVVSATMYDETYANIEMVTNDGKKIKLTMSMEEQK